MSNQAATRSGNVSAIDVHTHAMPLPLLKRLATRDLADVGGLDDGVVLLAPSVSGVAAGTPLPCPASQYDVDARIAGIDRMGVGQQVVSLPPFLFCTGSGDPGLTAEVVGRGNDELASFVAHRPDRFHALGTVPLGMPDAAEEARRCLDDLDMAGVTVGTQGYGCDLDDPVHEDLWGLLSEREAFCLLHPSGVPDPKRMGDYWLPQLVGYPTETALAVSRLVFGGVFERHALILCLAHGGGCLPSLRGRLDLGWERKGVARTTPQRPGTYLDRLYYDTAVFSPLLLRRLVQDVGPDHVLLGTDMPFDLSDTAPLQTVQDLNLQGSEAGQILSGNAAALLGINQRVR